MKMNRLSLPCEDLIRCRHGELKLSCASARPQAEAVEKTWHAVTSRLEAGVSRLLVSALLLWQASVSRAADVGVSIRLDSDWVELIRAQRRAQGVDAPDAHADARVEALLQRVQQRRVNAAMPSPHATRHGVVAANLPAWVIVY